MNFLEKLSGSHHFQVFMARLYGLGAAVVILGALFKIQHYQGAAIMLIIGMGTEAIIFFFSAFEKPHVEPDWSLVFPELAEQFHGIASNEVSNFKTSVSNTQVQPKNVSSGASQELDNLLKKANIDENMLTKLGEGFKNLNNTISSLNDITSVGGSSKVLSESMKQAGKTTDNYNQSLASINASYDLIIKKLNEQASANSSAQQSLNKSMEQFVASLQATAKMNEQFQKESAKLVQSIADLNQVYGNMLSAFNYTNKKS